MWWKLTEKNVPRFGEVCLFVPLFSFLLKRCNHARGRSSCSFILNGTVRSFFFCIESILLVIRRVKVSRHGHRIGNGGTSYPEMEHVCSTRSKPCFIFGCSYSSRVPEYLTRETIGRNLSRVRNRAVRFKEKKKKKKERKKSKRYHCKPCICILAHRGTSKIVKSWTFLNRTAAASPCDLLSYIRRKRLIPVVPVSEITL